MSFRILVILTTMFFPLSSLAEDVPKSVSGIWACTKGCTCSPASLVKAASISPNGTVRNECGFETRTLFEHGRLVVPAWKKEAKLTDDAQTLQWSDGSSWGRLRQDDQTLRILIAIWESRVFYCNANGAHFPSKESEEHRDLMLKASEKASRPIYTAGRDKISDCDDGDSVMFNALLCRNGDLRGCAAVKASQQNSGEDAGRYWRSPYKVKVHPKEPEGFGLPFDYTGLVKGETTLSGDHAQGLFLYFGHTRDRVAFERWVGWINSNGRVSELPGLTTSIGSPRYCKNDRCGFRAGDCQIFILLGERNKVGIPFCAAPPLVPLPTLHSTVATLTERAERITRRLPERPAWLVSPINDALRSLDKATAEVEMLKTAYEARMVRNTAISQLEASISTAVNKRGYSRHNAMLRIMMFQDWGYGKSWMTKVAVNAATQEPKNPFFQYVAFRDNVKKRRELIWRQIEANCPASDSIPATYNARVQWAWERDTLSKKWPDEMATTMYWDCIFAALLYQDKKSVKVTDDAQPGKLRAIYIDKRSEVQRASKEIEQKLAELEVACRKPVNCLKKPVTPWKNPFELLNQTKHNPIDSNSWTPLNPFP
jgi:hypothetical protein